jgi:anti-anti-sigma factor
MEGTYFDVETRAGTRSVRVRGELDLYNAPGLERALGPGDAVRDLLIVDLSGCRYIDSAGFAIVIRYHRALGERLWIVVAPESPLRRIFLIAGLEELVRSSPPAMAPA